MMKSSLLSFLTKSGITIALLLCFVSANAQNESDFWKRVRFGGAIGAAFGNNYTEVMLAPGALYEVNPYYGVGLSLQGSFAKQKNIYEAWMYGGSIINVVNPIPQIQLSAELEQLRVNLDFDERFTDIYGNNDRDFWNTALFLGLGYRTPNVVVGVRYHVLFDDSDYVYSEAWMPFIRVYF